MEEGKTLIRLNEFYCPVRAALDKMTLKERQSLLRLVVDAIGVEDGGINVEAIIPLDQGGALRNSYRELVEPRRISQFT